MNERTPVVATERASGDDLRLLRLSKRITAEEVAHHYGVKRPRISQLESEGEVTPQAHARYIAALRAVLAEREAQGRDA